MPATITSSAYLPTTKTSSVSLPDIVGSEPVETDVEDMEPDTPDPQGDLPRLVVSSCGPLAHSLIVTHIVILHAKTSRSMKVNRPRDQHCHVFKLLISIFKKCIVAKLLLSLFCQNRKQGF